MPRKYERMFRCQACDENDCENCVDVLRICLGLDPECPCTRKGHGGDAHGGPDHTCNEICEMVNGDTRSS